MSFLLCISNTVQKSSCILENSREQVGVDCGRRQPVSGHSLSRLFQSDTCTLTPAERSHSAVNWSRHGNSGTAKEHHTSGAGIRICFRPLAVMAKSDIFCPGKMGTTALSYR